MDPLQHVSPKSVHNPPSQSLQPEPPHCRHPAEQQSYPFLTPVVQNLRGLIQTSAGWVVAVAVNDWHHRQAPPLPSKS